MARKNNAPTAFSIVAGKEEKQTVGQASTPAASEEIRQEEGEITAEVAAAPKGFKSKRQNKSDLYKPLGARIHVDLDKQLNKVFKKEAKGVKQDFINYAIAKALKDEYGIEVDIPEAK